MANPRKKLSDDPTRKPGDTLNGRDKTACCQFVIYGHQTDAWLSAGFKSKSRQQASTNASQFFAREDVKEYLRYLEALRSQRLRATGDRVIHELEVMAYSTIADFASWTENELKFKPSEEIDPILKPAIAKVTQTGYGAKAVISIEMHPKLPALATLQKRFGIGLDPNELIAKVRSLGYDVVDRQIGAAEAEEQENEQLAELLRSRGYEVMKAVEEIELEEETNLEEDNELKDEEN